MLFRLIFPVIEHFISNDVILALSSHYCTHTNRLFECVFSVNDFHIVASGSNSINLCLLVCFGCAEKINCRFFFNFANAFLMIWKYLRNIIYLYSLDFRRHLCHITCLFVLNAHSFSLQNRCSIFPCCFYLSLAFLLLDECWSISSFDIHPPSNLKR